MKIFVQWATDDPMAALQELDSSEWDALPKRPAPVGGELIDDQPGWVRSLNIQGITPHKDHYCVEDMPNGSVKMTHWNDDPDDWTPEEFIAEETIIRPLKMQFNEVHGKEILNTDHHVIIYADPSRWDKFNHLVSDSIELKTWAEFVIPGQNKTMAQLNDQQKAAIYKNNNKVRHGVWLPDSLNNAHEIVMKKSSKVKRGWREWVE